MSGEWRGVNTLLRTNIFLKLSLIIIEFYIFWDHDALHFFIMHNLLYYLSEYAAWPLLQLEIQNRLSNLILETSVKLPRYSL